MTLKCEATPMIIITNYQPLPENATSFLLDSQLSSTGHSTVNNLF